MAETLLDHNRTGTFLPSKSRREYPPPRYAHCQVLKDARLPARVPKENCVPPRPLCKRNRGGFKPGGVEASESPAGWGRLIAAAVGGGESQEERAMSSRDDREPRLLKEQNHKCFCLQGDGELVFAWKTPSPSRSEHSPERGGWTLVRFRNASWSERKLAFALQRLPFSVRKPGAFTTFLRVCPDESGVADLPIRKLQLGKRPRVLVTAACVSFTPYAEAGCTRGRGGRMAPRLRGRAQAPRTRTVGPNRGKRGCVYHLAGESQALWGYGRDGEPFRPFSEVSRVLSGKRLASSGASGRACFTPSSAVVCACGAAQ